MGKFDDKNFVNKYRKRRRKYDPVFQESEKKAYERYKNKRKEIEEACPEIKEKRLAKQREYMRKYYKKKKKAEAKTEEGWLKKMWKEL